MWNTSEDLQHTSGGGIFDSRSLTILHSSSRSCSSTDDSLEYESDFDLTWFSAEIMTKNNYLFISSSFLIISNIWKKIIKAHNYMLHRIILCVKHLLNNEMFNKSQMILHSKIKKRWTSISAQSLNNHH